MAKVMVRLFASVREAAGESSSYFDASNLSELIELMNTRFGPALSRILIGRETDPESVVILVNGMNIGRKSTGAVHLSDGDEVAIFPPVSGG